MADRPPPAHDYVERIVRRVTPYLTDRGLGAETAKAGCSRCQACSPMAAVQDRLQIGPKPIATRG
jgi:ribosomal protein S27AE